MRGGEVLRETSEEVAKSGDVWRESRLVFLSGVGEGMRTNLSCLVVLGLFRDVLLFFDPDCPRFVAFSFIFLLALSFFQRNMPISPSTRLFQGRNMPSSSFSTPAKVEIRAI